MKLGSCPQAVEASAAVHKRVAYMPEKQGGTRRTFYVGLLLILITLATKTEKCLENQSEKGKKRLGIIIKIALISQAP